MQESSAKLTTPASDEAAAVMAISGNRLSEVEALVGKAQLARFLSRDDVLDLTLQRHEVGKA